MGRATAHFLPRPLGPGEGPKGQISITKSISKIFQPNVVYLFTHKIYKTYQTGFSFGRLGHAAGVGLGGTVGGLGSNFVFLNSTRFGV